jgi:RimJ/RimL family protein N-acetyltransferase
LPIPATRLKEVSSEVCPVPPFEVRPVVLEGRLVRLEPLGLDHAGPLAEAGADPSIFRWFSDRLDRPEAFAAWIATALDEQARGVSLPFAIVDVASGRVVGSTRFMNIVPAHLRVEIGGTWLAPAVQRTGANREAKFLMLRHAFEAWLVRRVEFKTHASNVQSRTALAGLGAVEEGTLRKHMVTPDGGVRDSVYFSFTDDEWPAVKARLGPDRRQRGRDDSPEGVVGRPELRPGADS